MTIEYLSSVEVVLFVCGTIKTFVNHNVAHDDFFFFSSRRRHTRSYGDWSSDVCSSDLEMGELPGTRPLPHRWVASRLDEQRWCIAPVRRELPQPPPPGAERRGRERMALEIGRASCRERVWG